MYPYLRGGRMGNLRKPLNTLDLDSNPDLSAIESWVELHSSSHTPDRVTPLPFNPGEEYLRLLREAQRESNQSSARVSLASSRRDTPRGRGKVSDFFAGGPGLNPRSQHRFIWLPNPSFTSDKTCINNNL
uniref:Uncharacterized protein n=1 Tax=Timema bartmani TaxID=61472 RepID=A0A7R9F3M8_9NEOP|nr:unnamed protein product [Timema bartmani]